MKKAEWKRLFAMFLALVMCLSLLPTAFAGSEIEPETCAEGHTYGEDGVCTVCGAKKPAPCAEGHTYGEDGLCTVCGMAEPKAVEPSDGVGVTQETQDPSAELDGLTVTLPGASGLTVTLTALSGDYSSAVQTMLGEGKSFTITSVGADIRVEGELGTGVTLVLSSDALKSMTEGILLVHITESGTAEKVDMNFDAEAGTITAEGVTSFSPYFVVDPALEVTAGTDSEGNKYAYGDSVTLSATAMKEGADLSSSVAWQWQQRSETSTDEDDWTDITGATEASYTFTYDETNWAQVYRAVATVGESGGASEAVVLVGIHNDAYTIDASQETLRIRLDVEYDILDQVTVSPAWDAETRLPVQVRIKNVTNQGDDATLFNVNDDYTEPNLLKVRSDNGAGATRTQAYILVEYEAYVMPEGAETIALPTEDGEINYIAINDTDVGEDSTGMDVAYIVDLEMTDWFDGTEPFDDKDDPGYDSVKDNKLVRTYDVVGYNLQWRSEVYPNSDFRTYKQGRVGFEFLLPGTADEIMFELDNMSWLFTEGNDAEYTILEVTDDTGATWQVMRGSFLWKSAGENDTPIGAGQTGRSVGYRVLTRKNGDVLEPKFTLWMVGNDVPQKDVPVAELTAENYQIVTGSGPCSSSTHSSHINQGQEVVTFTPEPVTVSAYPFLDIRLASTSAGASSIRNWNFSTGNENAPNKDAGVVNGRRVIYGVTVLLRRPDSGRGMRGIEIPAGPLTFDLEVGLTFREQGGTEEIDVMEDYTPLLWSRGYSWQWRNDAIDPSTGRLVATWNMATVSNKWNGREDRKRSSAYDGGTWTFVDTGDATMRVTLEGYQFDFTQLPFTTNSGTSNTFYNPDNYPDAAKFWLKPIAVFAGGSVAYIVPMYNNKTGEHILDDLGYDDGGFTLSLKDYHMVANSVSGQHVEDGATDNSAQVKQDNDRSAVSVPVSRPGSLNSYVWYKEYKQDGWDDPLSANCRENGKDWTVPGGLLRIDGYIHQSKAEIRQAYAMDEFVKFDDEFFEIESVVPHTARAGTDSPASDRILFAAKPDGSGWASDEEMKLTTPDSVVFYSSLEALEADGKTCVGVMREYRHAAADSIYDVASNGIVIGVYLDGRALPTAEVGKVYMVTHDCYAWAKEDIEPLVRAWKAANGGGSKAPLRGPDDGTDSEEPEAELTRDDYNAFFAAGGFPSHYNGDGQPGAKYEGENNPYPTFRLRKQWKDANGKVVNSGLNYHKATYDDAGYVDGDSGMSYGDSALVVGHTANVEIQVASVSGGAESLAENGYYNLDLNQRYADFRVMPMIRLEEKDLHESTNVDSITDVTITLTIPSDLHYVPNSMTFGGTYTPPSSHGARPGTVSDGETFSDSGDYVITESTDANGNTILTMTIKNVELHWTESGTAEVPDLRYSVSIGAPGTDHDVENNQQFKTTVGIHTTQDKRDLSGENGNLDDATVIVARTSQVSILDNADQVVKEVVKGNTPEESTATFGFTMSARNDAETPIVDAVIVAHTPWKDDPNSDFDGDVTINSFVLTDVPEGTRVFYSTNEEDRTKIDHTKSDLDEGWIELTVGPGGVVDLSGVDTKTVTAIAVLTDIPANTTMTMNTEVTIDHAKPNQLVEHSLSLNKMQVYARSYTLTRALSGRAWLDSDKNGLYDRGEKLFSEVEVKLWKLNEDTGEYEPFIPEGGTEQYTVLTDAKGEYLFDELPEGNFAVSFEDERGTEDGIYSFELTEKDVENDTHDTLDSDAEEKEGTFWITDIIMPPVDDITVQRYVDPHNDVGVTAIDFPVNKIWDDANDQDGYRPASIDAKLLADDTDTGKSLKLNEDNEWAGTFINLPVYTGGMSNRSEIVYTVDETALDEYEEPVIVGDMETGFTITNKHEPKEIEIEVEKAWVDGEDQDGLRPASVTIVLVIDGTDSDKTLTLSESNQWKDSFTELPKYRNKGTEIVYTIKEVQTDVITETDSETTYGLKVDGNVVDGFVVTNTHTPVEIEIEVEKAWDDADDRDGCRPDDVTVVLVQDDQATDKTLTLSESNQWKGSFTNLPKFKEKGTEIVYTVVEQTDNSTITGTDGAGTYAIKVDGTVQNGFIITNTHTPETVDIPVEKVWEGSAEQSALLQPASITVKLLADGTEKDSVVLSADNSWKHTFEKLPVYKEGAVGQKIVYTIEEVEVTGYVTEITGSVEDGFTVTNTPFEPAKVILSVTKELMGRDWEDDDAFEFTLAASGEAPMPASGGETVVVTKANNPGQFGEISYLKKGTFTYTITETKGTLDGVAYDTASHTVTVTVAEDTTTKALTASVSYDRGTTSQLVTNVFSPVSVQLEVTKELQGREWTTEDSFTFSLTAVTQDAPMPTDSGTVTVTKAQPIGVFGSMSFKKAGTYEYVILETDDGKGGITYDTARHQVVVEVSKDSNNALSATVSYDKEESLTVTNVYDATGTVQFEAKKVLQGRQLVEEEFSFVLKDAAGKEVETVKNDAEGKIVFSELSYTLSADKEKLPLVYTIEELESGLPGVTDETGVITVTVNFTDNGDGTLTVVKTYSGLANETFTNIYESSGEYELSAEKILEGRKLEAGQFHVELVDEDGVVLQTVANDADGVFTFEPLTYDQTLFKTDDGYVETIEKTYTLREVDEKKPGYTYDDTEYTIKLTLTDDQEGNIVVEQASEEEEYSFTFENEYNSEGEIRLEAEKHFDGGTLKEHQFTFELRDETGKVIETVKNDAVGKVPFSVIPVDNTIFADGETTAVLTYTVNEDVPLLKAAGVTYDTRKYTATVTLTDKGDGTIATAIAWSVDGKAAEKAVFVNTFTYSPKTSDSHDFWRLSVLAVFALLGTGMTLLAPRKKSKHSR